VEPIHVAFAPSDDEVRWARRVIELMNSAQGPGAAALDGKMIDRPHLRQAERIIAALGRS
jgi:citrate lyase subunit beta / citryl-CoA lyase